MTITLVRLPTGWVATFRGGDMPQGIALPLPWTAEASVIRVAKDIRTRFEGATVFYRCALGQRHHCP